MPKWLSAAAVIAFGRADYRCTSRDGTWLLRELTEFRDFTLA